MIISETEREITLEKMEKSKLEREARGEERRLEHVAFMSLPVHVFTCKECGFEYNSRKEECPACRIAMRRGGTNKLIQLYPHLYGDKFPDDRCKYYMQTGGFETSEGWDDLLTRLSAKVDSYLKKNPIKDFMVHQVKSKFATLCYYTSHYNEGIRKLVKEAEKEACETCENCGSKENVTLTTEGWMTRLCEKCHKDK